MYRTHNCNQLKADDEKSCVTLSGWAHRVRDHGGLIFIDIRDRYGYTQLVSDPDNLKETHKAMEQIKSEYVIKITGTVRKRPDGMVNKSIDTGEVEVVVKELEILNEADVLPFEVDQDKDLSEEIRLEHRYLDLRRDRMKNNVIMRHKIIKYIRDHMDKREFLEIETPILIKGTPEGSREYLVPSRLHPGKFYVLPQAPQQLKQMLMVAGMDKYFQIARCFRDEDQRGDRQPEFTQLDIEMSFVEEEDVLKVNEELAVELIKKLKPAKKVRDVPFIKMSWQEAMDKYGSDKPDLRFKMEITDITDLVKDSGFQVFADAVKAGNLVRALKVDGGAEFSRKDIDGFTEIAKEFGAKGLVHISIGDEIKSPISKFVKEKELKTIIDKCGAKKGDMIFIVADEFKVVCETLSHIRVECGKRFNLMDKDNLVFVWITHFPLFEFNKEDGKLVSSHHPFTHPMEEDIDLLDEEPEKVRAKAYDLVLNGVEIAGGSIRIHDPKLQSKIFDILGISKEDAGLRFGHLLKAFTFGAPPHGGIAWGLDRFIMLMQDEPNIREVIPFPKDQKGRDLMVHAPSELPDEQIAEANIRLLKF
ncbi:aspartate--tRNA ligase [Patescibacteria group bacterium]|nr:aspartate--tRNA ligase [Patescibacteria group bacterium]